jgi:hypothetical protein
VAPEWRNHTNITIIITTATVATVVSDTIVAGGAIVAVDSVVRVPAVISIGQPGVQETSCRLVFLGRLIVIVLFRGGVMPFLGHIVVIVFVF